MEPNAVISGINLMRKIISVLQAGVEDIRLGFKSENPETKQAFSDLEQRLSDAKVSFERMDARLHKEQGLWL